MAENITPIHQNRGDGLRRFLTRKRAGRSKAIDRLTPPSDTASVISTRLVYRRPTKDEAVKLLNVSDTLTKLTNPLGDFSFPLDTE